MGRLSPMLASLLLFCALTSALAKSGSSKGAFALARSYDPAYIAAAPGASIAPDLNKALQWYRRAAALGSLDARNRLAEIAPGR